MVWINRRITQQKARLHRLKAAGHTPPHDKASARKLIEQACADQQAVTVIPQGQRRLRKPDAG